MKDDEEWESRHQAKGKKEKKKQQVHFIREIYA